MSYTASPGGTYKSSTHFKGVAPVVQNGPEVLISLAKMVPNAVFDFACYRNFVVLSRIGSG